MGAAAVIGRRFFSGLLLAPAVVPAASLMRLPPPTRRADILAEWIGAGGEVLAAVVFPFRKDAAGRWIGGPGLEPVRLLHGSVLDPRSTLIRASAAPRSLIEGRRLSGRIEDFVLRGARA